MSEGHADVSADVNADVRGDVKGMRQPAKRAGQARTRLARRAVVESAKELFLDNGYPATTIEAISERSDVPPATIYRLFSSKLGILKALLDTAIAGDDQGVTLQGRPEVAELFAEADPEKLLAGFVGISVAINTRTRSSDIYAILLSAAAADSDAAALLTDYAKQRDQGQGLISATLARIGALRPGVGERDAADIIHALLSPDLYRLLVVDRGWPTQRYERWLASVLVDQLLPGRHDEGPEPRRTSRRSRA